MIGLVVLYGLALAKRGEADFHKRAMLLTLVAIMYPATARIGMVLGFPPFPLLADLVFVGTIIWHDRRVLKGVHIITWFGFAWIFIHLGLVFDFAATDLWSGIAEELFG